MHRFQARYPEPRRLPVLLGLLPLLALERRLVLFAPLLAVAVVGLVVQHQDVLHAHELGHHAAQHPAFGFPGVGRGAAALEERPASLRDLDALPAPEGVVVGDDDLRPVEVGQQVVRHEVAAAVVAVRVVRLQHPQPIPDGEAGGDDQEPPGEAAALRPAHRVDGLPGDQHGHHGGLARAGGELEREAEQPRVRLPGGVLQVSEEAPAGLARVGGDLGQPDGGLDRLDLAEEGPDAGETVMPPVPEEARGLGGHPPLPRVRSLPPLVDLAADAVDDPGVLLVLLRAGGEPLALVEDQGFLGVLGFLGVPGFMPRGALPAAFLRLRDGGDEFGPAAALDDLPGRLAVRVELPMPAGIAVRGVEDRVLEESVVHVRPPSAVVSVGLVPVTGSWLKIRATS